MTEQAPELWPLTCQYCRNAPATHVLVADIYFGGRMRDLVCNQCGRVNLPKAMSVSKCKESAWLFVLVPAGKDAAGSRFRSSGPSLGELDAYGDFAPERRES